MVNNHYTINITANQAVLHFSSGHAAPDHCSDSVIDGLAAAEISQLLREKYSPKKRDNMFLADAYQLSGMHHAANKAARLATCSRWLEFAVPPEGDDSRYKLVKTSSCHVRLCPVCQWRRSVNTYRNLARIYNAAEVKNMKHLFVTLTVKNCSGDVLSAEVKNLSDAFAVMMKRQPFKGLVKGYTRTIEITINEDGSFHPHIHSILSVTRSYGSREYIRQKDLCIYWQDAAGLDYVPVCDIRAIKNMDGKSVAEVAKYSVKPQTYIRHGDLNTTASLVEVLDPALDGKRFVSYGGLIRQVKTRLFAAANIEDVDATAIPEKEWESWERRIYEWHFSDESYHLITEKP